MNGVVQNRSSRNRLAALHPWLADGDRAARLWLGRYSVPVAWIGLALAAITPPDGFGFPLCWWKDGTGLPCPGCGVTRSLSCAARGLIVESVQYHPFGFPILVLFFATAVWSLLPAQQRTNAKTFLSNHPVLFNSAYLVFVTSFVSFGFLRSLHYWIIRCW